MSGRHNRSPEQHGRANDISGARMNRESITHERRHKTNAPLAINRDSARSCGRGGRSPRAFDLRPDSSDSADIGVFGYESSWSYNDHASPP